jgi:hypothetical protein
MVSKAIIDTVLKRRKERMRSGSNAGLLCRRRARFQLSYRKLHESSCTNSTCQLTVKKLHNRIVYYKKLLSVDTKYFGQEVRGRVHCHTVNFGPNRRVTIDGIPLLVTLLKHVHRPKPLHKGGGN